MLYVAHESCAPEMCRMLGAECRLQGTYARILHIKHPELVAISNMAKTLALHLNKLWTA
jgi:hypothetical protein